MSSAPIHTQVVGGRYFHIINAIGWLLYGAFTFAMGEIWSASERYLYVQTPFTVLSGIASAYFLRFVFQQTWGLANLWRIFWGVSAFIFAVVLWSFLNAEFNYAIVTGKRSDDPNHLIGWTKFNLFVLAAWSALYLTGKYFLLFKKATQIAEKAEALAQKSRLETLRYQLNPHFLFNSLNAINTLILDKQTDTASKTVTELSRYLRFSLDNCDEQVTTVEKEISRLQDYVSIESIRFGERLAVSFSVEPETRGILLPAMLLQPLVENTIKHAISVVETPITLNICIALVDDALHITVQDNGPGATLTQTGDIKNKGVGVSNLIERLSFYYQNKAVYSFSNSPSGGFVVTLHLPHEELIELN